MPLRRELLSFHQKAGRAGQCAVDSESDCDRWCQDCPSGQKCVPVVDTQESPAKYFSRCEPLIEDPIPVGETCDGTAPADGCVQGAVCWPPEEGGICTALCTGTPENPTCADPSKRCLLGINNEVALCLAFCNPLTQDCPESSDGCYFATPDCEGLGCPPWGLRETFVCHLDFGQDTQYPDPCSGPEYCALGMACVVKDTLSSCSDAACCTPYCDLGDEGFSCPDSDNGMQCLPAFADGTAPTGLEYIGICRLP